MTDPDQRRRFRGGRAGAPRSRRPTDTWPAAPATSTRCAANAAAFERWQLRPRVLVDVGERVDRDDRPRHRRSRCPSSWPDGLPARSRPGGRARDGAGGRGCGDGDDPLDASRASPRGGGRRGARRARSGSSSTGRATAGSRKALVAAAAEAGLRCDRAHGRLPVAGRARARRARRLRAAGRPAAAEHPPASLRRENFHAALREHRRRDAHLARPRVAALLRPLPARGQGDPDRRGRAAGRGARRRRSGRLEPRRPAARRRAGARSTSLPEVAEAVGERVEVLVDGGIRRGTDVLKALALGARSAMSGPSRALGPGRRGRGGRCAGAGAAPQRDRGRPEAARLHLACGGRAGPGPAGRIDRMIRPRGTRRDVDDGGRPHARVLRAGQGGRRAGDRLARHPREPVHAPSRPGDVRAPRRARGRLRPPRLRPLRPASRPHGGRRGGRLRSDRRRARLRALRRGGRLWRRAARARLRRVAGRPGDPGRRARHPRTVGLRPTSTSSTASPSST